MVLFKHLIPDRPIPDFKSNSPYAAVLILEVSTSKDWMYQLSDFLVNTGFRYMMAWGVNCSQWDDSVDFANLEK